MSFVSYAQNFEDVMLWRALKHIPCGTYIDVGAAWPDMHSVTKAFYIMGWHGINVEPNPDFYEQLLKNRPEDTNIQMAISDSEGIAQLHLFQDTGLSTIDENIAKNYSDMHFLHSVISVTQNTLKNIWQSYIPKDQEVHFLKVDVEGLEAEVLRGNDWFINRPWIVLVESTIPLSQVENYHNWEFILTEASYIFAYADGLNRFYVDSCHPDLLEAFKYPPNVFDELILSSEVIALDLQHQAEVRASDLHRELTNILESRSWRFTKPFRKVDKYLQRIKGFYFSAPKELKGNDNEPLHKLFIPRLFNDSKLSKLERLVASELDKAHKINEIID